MRKVRRQEEAKARAQERHKMRYETLAKYLYDLSKLSFAGSVVGVLTPLITNVKDTNTGCVFLSGLVITISLAWIGDKILKG